MSACLTSTSSSLHQQCVLSSWCFQCELIERQDLTTSFQNTYTGTFGKSECANRQLGDIEKSDVVSHCTNNHADLVSFRSFHSANRNWWLVRLAHKQSF